MKSLAVVGSSNGDLYIEVGRLPRSGETLEGRSGGNLRPGGKGANQAAAAGLLGAQTYFCGQVGKDHVAEMLRKNLGERRVNLQHLEEVEGVPSGQAVIFLLPDGENSIVIIGGANAAWEQLSESHKEAISRCDALLLQREIPDQINLEAAKVAKSNGKIVVMDCGGRESPIPEELLNNIDIISPNATELENLTGIYSDPEAAAKKLQSLGVPHIVLKLGEKGAVYIGERTLEQKGFKDPSKEILDTTGAGDCFTAALVVKLLEEGFTPEGFSSAMEFACAAAFLSITKVGAMESVPSRNQVLEFLNNH